MSSLFLPAVGEILSRTAADQDIALQAAAEAMGTSLVEGRRVYFYGSGHSCLPVLDVFPRYGSYVGLQPIHDPRLMWSNVLGPGGVRELLWLERTEGYVQNVLKSYPIGPGDTVIVYSHGGLNAAPVEAAMIARDLGATVVAVTSLDGLDQRQATHSSGNRLADVATICIDTGAPAPDAIVSIPDVDRKVAASSTVLAVALTMELVARAAAVAAAAGADLSIFSSPVGTDDGKGNDFVFDDYATAQSSLGLATR
jgi:uncharacterized phosphosugar-binding protein